MLANIFVVLRQVNANRVYLTLRTGILGGHGAFVKMPWELKASGEECNMFLSVVI